MLLVFSQLVLTGRTFNALHSWYASTTIKAFNLAIFTCLLFYRELAYGRNLHHRAWDCGLRRVRGKFALFASATRMCFYRTPQAEKYRVGRACGNYHVLSARDTHCRVVFQSVIRSALPCPGNVCQNPGWPCATELLNRMFCAHYVPSATWRILVA